MKELIKMIEDEYGIQFKNEMLLVEAFTHSSYVNEHRQKKLIDNEYIKRIGADKKGKWIIIERK